MVRFNNFNPALATALMIAMFFILFLMLPSLMFGQTNEIEVEQDGNQICITGTDLDVGWYQFHVQNADQLSQNFSFWTNQPDTCIQTPFCNMRINRTAYFSPTEMVFSNVVETNTIDFAVKAYVNYPYISIDLRGNWEEVTIAMYDLSTKQTGFYSGMTVEVDEEGFYTVQPVLKYGKINHPRVITFIAQKDGCVHKTSKIIYY